MRILKFIGMAACAAAFIAATAAFNARTCFTPGKSYTFFCGDTSRDCRIVTAERGAALRRLFTGDVCGESTTYDTLDIAAFLKGCGGEVKFCEELSDSVNLYCTADLPYSVLLYGQEINLHVCIKQDGVTVASPIIFGGY